MLFIQAGILHVGNAKFIGHKMCVCMHMHAWPIIPIPSVSVV